MLGVTGLLLALGLLVITGCGGGGNTALKAQYQVPAYCRSRTTAVAYQYTSPAPRSTVVRCIELSPWTAPDMTYDSYGWPSAVAPNQDLAEACGINEFFLTVFDWDCNNITSQYTGTYSGTYGDSPYINVGAYEYSDPANITYYGGTSVPGALPNITWGSGGTPDWTLSGGSILIELDSSQLAHANGRLTASMSIPVGDSMESHSDAVFFSGVDCPDTPVAPVAPTVTGVSIGGVAVTDAAAFAVPVTSTVGVVTFDMPMTQTPLPASTTVSLVNDTASATIYTNEPAADIGALGWVDSTNLQFTYSGAQQLTAGNDYSLTLGFNPTEFVDAANSVAVNLTNSTLPTGVTVSGNSLTVSFTAEEAVTPPAPMAPRITGVSVNGTAVTTNANPVNLSGSQVTVDFDMPMTQTAPTGITVSLINNTAGVTVENATDVSTLGTVSWIDADTLGFSLTDTSRLFSPSSDYSFGITLDPSLITDSANSLALDLTNSTLPTGVTVSGNTISGDFATKATAVGFSPSGDVPYNTIAGAVTFSEAMDPATVSGTALLVTLVNNTASATLESDTPVGDLGDLSWSSGNTVLGFSLTSGQTLTPSNDYTVTLSVPLTATTAAGFGLDLNTMVDPDSQVTVSSSGGYWILVADFLATN